MKKLGGEGLERFYLDKTRLNSVAWIYSSFGGLQAVLGHISGKLRDRVRVIISC